MPESRFHITSGRYTAPPNTRYAAYIKGRKIDGKDEKALAYHDKQIPETHGTYGALILHPNWKAKRKEILLRDNHRCVLCKDISDLQVHHRQYHFIKALKKFKVPWDYPDDLLITLCSKCHSRGHSKFKVPSILI